MKRFKSFNYHKHKNNDRNSKNKPIKELLVKNGTSLPNSEMVGKANDSIDNRLTDSEISLSDKIQTSEPTTEQESGINITESEVIEKLEDTSKLLEPENMDDEPSEPKELILDLNQEANGINGRYNDQGLWCSWTDIMPYNDGNLSILPYVILD